MYNFKREFWSLYWLKSIRIKLDITAWLSYRCWKPLSVRNRWWTNRDVPDVPDSLSTSRQLNIPPLMSAANFASVSFWREAVVRLFVCDFYKLIYLNIIPVQPGDQSSLYFCTSNHFWFTYSTLHFKIFISLMNIDVTFDYC